MTGKECFWICVISWFVFVVAAFIARRWYLKRRYGCTRCSYRRLVESNGCLRRMCTASCGNQDGRACPAWRFDNEKEATA